MQKLGLNQTLAKISKVWFKSSISYAENGFNFKTDLTMKLSPRYLSLFPCWLKFSFNESIAAVKRQNIGPTAKYLCKGSRRVKRFTLLIL